MPRLQTRIIYGLRTNITGNAHYVNDDEVVYLVGNNISLHNYSQQRQRLYRLIDKRKINTMTISPNRKFVALAEYRDKPLISIYDLKSLKKKKVFGVPSDSIEVTSFTCLSFTLDSKYLAAVTNETQTMMFYNFEKGKLESSLEVGNLQIVESKINLISCNPGDTSIIALGGTYVFKFLTLSENIWCPYGFSKADNLIITSLAWLNSDRLLAGTVDGRILFFENGDLKNIYTMSNTTIMNFKIKEEFVIHNTTSQTNIDEKSSVNFQRIQSIISFNNGFAFAFGYRTVIVFEKNNQYTYTKRNVYVIPSQVLKDDDDSLYMVNTISANPSGDKLLITTGWSKLFYVTMWGPEYASETEPQYFKVLGNDLHHGPIGGLSTCSWKSHVMTFGKFDRSIRLWDFHTQNLIMMKLYLQDITCTVLHPLGLFCLIGFTDKLRFMNILINDLSIIKEFPIRNCEVAAFSNGGHLFAAVNRNIMLVYSTIDFDIRFQLKGHVEIIQEIIWSQNDAKLVSIGLEGAIYQWDMNTGGRLSEIVLKGITLCGIVLAADASTVYCISKDNKIYEIKDNSNIYSFNIPNIQPTKILMGKSDSLMFITYSGGFVGLLKSPIQDPIEFKEYHFHHSDITQIRLSYDQQVLITTDSVGTICFWKISYADGKIGLLYRDFFNFNQILISRTDLAGKMQIIKDLNTRLKELQAEHDYQTRQTILQHNDKVLLIHQNYCEAIEELRDKIDKLEQSHTNEINNINIDIDNTKKIHEETMHQMEVNYDAKLIFEYDKYDKLEADFNAMRQNYEDKLDNLMKTSKDELDSVISKHEIFMQEKELQLREAHEEMSKNVQVHEIIKIQMEDDTDREIVDLRTNYESKLYEERQFVLKLKGEAGVLKSKQKTYEKEVEDLKWQLNNLKEEYTHLISRKEEMEKFITDLKDELLNKESMITDKDKNIKRLDCNNRELEKFKFVLNERIKELMSEIEPRDKTIDELKKKVDDMEAELVGLNKVRRGLESRHYELKGKLNTLRQEFNKEELRRKRYQKLLRKIRIDLLEAVGLIQDPMALKNCVIKLYRRYSDVDEFLRSHKADMDAQCEFMKQRNHLERSIAILKKQLVRTDPIVEAKLNKVLEENIMLLAELNSLKEELKSAQKHIGDMENLLGAEKERITPMEAKANHAKVFHDNEQLEQHYQTEIQECKSIIGLLMENIDRLTCRHVELNT
ncbi:PREDICTED: cilia- and flagella-associated protein 57 [Ceratosolen solmsi marchali]|uniref:Cilia- and flagella-associated protein 57 n=1 Tax=Ceratosolen solmsi marchali TaxID=326594 RepID=A0AAJ7DZZ4_9HYME|nr:PREDICTED: cilia- and flagella-associated protein 57 [Ceratosolen solmsi marchali]